jgi:hypothetical protein
MTIFTELVCGKCECRFTPSELLCIFTFTNKPSIADVRLNIYALCLVCRKHYVELNGTNSILTREIITKDNVRFCYDGCNFDYKLENVKLARVSSWFCMFPSYKFVINCKKCKRVHDLNFKDSDIPQEIVRYVYDMR